MVLELNDNDNKLLAFCLDFERSIGEIAKHLDIAPKNVSIRLEKLEKEGLIKVNRLGHGKRTYIRTKEGDKTNDYMIKALKEIKKRNGITMEEYSKLFMFNPLESDGNDSWSAISLLPFTDLVEQKLFLSPKGEAELKKHSKK